MGYEVDKGGKWFDKFWGIWYNGGASGGMAGGLNVGMSSFSLVAFIGVMPIHWFVGGC